MRADNEVLLVVDFFWIPAHCNILGEAEEITTGFVEQHITREGQLAISTMPFGAGVSDLLCRAENIF